MTFASASGGINGWPLPLITCSGRYAAFPACIMARKSSKAQSYSRENSRLAESAHESGQRVGRRHELCPGLPQRRKLCGRGSCHGRRSGHHGGQYPKRCLHGCRHRQPDQHVQRQHFLPCPGQFSRNLRAEWAGQDWRGWGVSEIVGI